MAILFTAFQAQVERLTTSNDDELDQDRRDAQILAAVDRYSIDRPKTYTDDYTGTGSKYLAATTAMPSWVEGFSRVVDIEYPATASPDDEDPQYLEPEDWRDDYWRTVASVRTRYVYLPNHQPSASETLRITYTVPWLWTPSATTGGTVTTSSAHGFAVNDYIYQTNTTWAKAAVSVRNSS